MVKLRTLASDKSLLLGAPTDWWDPSAHQPGAVRHAVAGHVGGARHVGRARRGRPRRVPVPAAVSEGQAAVVAGGWPAMVSAKSKDVEAAKAFTKWLWVDNLEDQEDWCLNYGFHIPPRKSLAAKAREAAGRRRRRERQAEHRPRRRRATRSGRRR